MIGKSKSNNIDRTLRRATILLIFGIGFIMFTPFLFTRNLFWESLDFSKTGEIGDTIGGITAPFVNLLGAILVYFALDAQVKANRLIQDQIDTQREEDTTRKRLHYISEKVTLVTNDLNEFSYTREELIGEP